MTDGIPAPKDGAQQPEGRRRSESSHRAILDAALELLGELGYRAITIEGIASRAGVGKQTIYRWWPSKAAVVLEALLKNAAVSIVAPDSGSLRGDLEAYLDQAYQTMSGPLGPILRGLTSEVLLDEDFKEEFLRLYEEPWRQTVASILRRAAARGEIPGTYDESLILDMLFGFKWLRLIFGHAPLDPGLAPRVAAMAEALARS